MTALLNLKEVTHAKVTTGICLIIGQCIYMMSISLSPSLLLLSAAEMSLLWLLRWRSNATTQLRVQQGNLLDQPGELSTRELLLDYFYAPFLDISKHFYTLLCWLIGLFIFKHLAEQVKLSHAWWAKPNIIASGSKWSSRWVWVYRPSLVLACCDS